MLLFVKVDEVRADILKTKKMNEWELNFLESFINRNCAGDIRRTIDRSQERYEVTGKRMRLIFLLYEKQLDLKIIEEN